MLVDANLAKVQVATRTMGMSEVLWRVDRARPKGSVTASQWPRLTGRPSHCLWSRARNKESTECGRAELPEVTRTSRFAY